MRKIILILALLLTPLALPAIASAQVDPLGEVCTGRGESSPACQSDNDDPIAGSDGVIMRVVNILSWVTGAVAILMGVYAGLKYVLANGDSNSIAGARNTILYALIGVVIFAASQLIIRFVIGTV